MGCTYIAKLAIGVPVTEALMSKKVQKYNEDTGKPYSKTIDKTFWCIKETKTEINVDSYEESDSDSDIQAIWVNEHLRILGILLAEASVYDVYKPVDLSKIEPARLKLTTHLKKKYKCDLSPSVYIVQYVNC